MNVTNNSRFRETEERLKTALLCIIKDKRKIESVTVTELCQKSRINRKTFYSHYSVPLDILCEIENERLSEAIKYRSNINGHENEKTISFLEHIKEKQEVFKVLLNAENRDFVNKLVSLILPTFDRIEFYSEQKNIFHYVKTYTLVGAETIIREWRNKGFKEDCNTISQLIIQLAKESIDLSFRFKVPSSQLRSVTSTKEN